MQRSAKTIARVKEIYMLIIDGVSTSGIHEHCLEQWGVRHSMADRYISKARDLLIRNADKDIEEYRAIANERYNDLYRRCLGYGDFKTCVAVQNSMDKINGLCEKKVSVDVVKDPYETFFANFGALADGGGEKTDDKR